MSTREGLLKIDAETQSTQTNASFARRAPRISRDDVHAAADALLLDGHRPSIDRVRMKLGRGSPNTINDHLDTWWANLGSRLRDLPGQEFPQLPERVALTLQQLWTEALAGAHDSLQATQVERERALAQAQGALEQRDRQLAEREQSVAARITTLEEALALARDQLDAANQRAVALERNVGDRESECARLRERLSQMEADSTHWRSQFDAVSVAHQAERRELLERSAAAENRWLMEIDRARQQVREKAQEHEQQRADQRRRIEALQSEREQQRQELLELRIELKRVCAERNQLIARMNKDSGAVSERSPKTRAVGRPQAPGPGRRTSRSRKSPSGATK